MADKNKLNHDGLLQLEQPLIKVIILIITTTTTNNNIYVFIFIFINFELFI